MDPWFWVGQVLGWFFLTIIAGGFFILLIGMVFGVFEYIIKPLLRRK